MALNRQLLAQSLTYANSEIPFVFNQTNIVTDPDRAYFPYTYWFRGEYMSDIPIIVDREAGFRPRVEIQTIPVGAKRPTKCATRRVSSAVYGPRHDASSDESEDDDMINNFSSNLRENIRQKYYTTCSPEVSKYNNLTPCFRGSKQQMRDCFTNGKNKYIETDPTYLDNRQIYLYR